MEYKQFNPFLINHIYFQNELKQVLEIGVDSENIIYANPCKQKSHLQFAANNIESLRTTFDNECELHKIKKLCPEAR